MTIIAHFFIVYWQFLIPVTLTMGALAAWLVHRLRRNKRSKECFLGALSTESRRLLTAARIKFRTGLTANHQYGLFINQKDRQKALKALKVEVRESRFGTGSEEKLETLILTFTEQSTETAQAARCIYFMGKFNAPKSTIADAVAATLMPIVDGNFFIYGSGATSPPADSDGDFHLILNLEDLPTATASTPQVTCSDVKHFSNLSYPYRNVAANRIWGTHYKHDLRTRAPSPLAIPLLDSYTGFYPLEIQGNKLYFLFDVLQDCEKEPHWFARLWGIGSERKNSLPLLEHCLKNWLEERDREIAFQHKLAEENLAIMPLSASRKNAPYPFSVRAVNFVESANQLRKPLLLADLAAQILGPYCGKALTLINMSGKTRPPNAGPNELIIVYHGAAAETRQTFSPSHYWRHKAVGAENLYAPSSQGLPFYTPEGLAVGELIGNNLYLFPEATQLGTIAEAGLWVTLLAEARRLIEAVNSGKSPEDIMAEAFGQDLQRQMNLSKSGRANSEQLKAATTKLEAALRGAMEAQQNIFQAETLPYKDLGEEFDSILAIPKVTNAKVTEKAIIVSTKTLYCRDSRTNILHEIGPFEISIDPVNASGIRWHNKSGRSTPHNHQAPHVDPSGKACFGNTAETFSLLIGARQYAAAVEVAIAFVESANVDDLWGKRINEWPQATHQE